MPSSTCMMTEPLSERMYRMPDQTISQLWMLFDQQGNDPYFGEPVTQLEHALQCAGLAERAGADNETVIAAFLHDIGHLLPVESATGYMDGYGTIDHERLGADYLRQRGFSEKETLCDSV